ncbi:MAG: hypothetical protein Q7I99_09240 [Acholeplasmataceae bacterium]|nr:hypothetical protein [Acholeplasmataceae bacterium]
MPTKNQLSENRRTKTRLEILKSWMSSFVMATAAIIVVVVFVPNSPKASIISATAFQSEIIYQIEITDEDEALDLSTLVIVLSNQFGQKTQSLRLGMNVGVFEELTPNTRYVLTVYGSKGFGNEKLDERILITEKRSGGAIINLNLIESHEWNHVYNIEVLIRDEEELYKNVYFYYAYIYDEEMDDPFYDQILVEESRQIIELYEVPTQNIKVHVYLEAELKTGGVAILDEIYFFVPFQLENPIYLEHIDQTMIEYVFYHGYSTRVDVTYTFDLFYGKQKVQSQVIQAQVKEDIMHSSNTIVSFNQLKKDSLYLVRISATYQNPITLRNETVILLQEEVKTLGDYQIDFEITKDMNSYQVYIYLNDPNHYFQSVSYILYDRTGEFITYIETMSYGFIPDLNGKYQEFSFNIPDLDRYQIVIRVTNDTEYVIYHIVMDEIIKP